jgi:hypothetical protein
MRVMLMHATNADNEADKRPPDTLIAGVRRSIEEMGAAGIFRDGTGLRASSLGVRVRFRGGARTVTPGPFAGGNELTAALCALRVRSRDEVVAWATRFAAIVGDAEVDIRPITEPWDLGFGTRPADDPTTRYMAVVKADAASEAGVLPDAEARAAVAALIDDAKAAGVFLGGEVLQPGARAKRIVREGGKARVLDGPFTESKELIAGYAMIEVPTIDDAMPWAMPYQELLASTLDVRPLYEAADLR